MWDYAGWRDVVRNLPSSALGPSFRGVVLPRALALWLIIENVSLLHALVSPTRVPWELTRLGRAR